MGKSELWDDFCLQLNVIGEGVPLFDSDGMQVQTMPYGSDQRLVLKRSQEMESLVIGEVNKVIRDYHEGADLYDGLIYMMFWKRDNKVLPLYIGKSEKFGRKNGNLSSNIEKIETNTQRFCRWGYSYAYHIGDLSAIACTGHPESKRTPKYEKWANTLFKSYPSESPALKEQTYFWMTAWSHKWTGVWKEFGETSLTFLEYLLIGLASDLYPDLLLNDEGVNRK